MKGIQGLVLAIALGIAGAAFNWFYLSGGKSGDEVEYYVGISPDATVERGESLGESDLVKVPIPRSNIGNLDDFAVKYSDRATVVAERVWRTLTPGSLLLVQDLKTPAKELKFGGNERVVWIPVDTRTFVPSLVKPGDQVSFLVSPSRAGSPTPAGLGDFGAPEPVRAGSGPIDTIGPFTILALGNRLGSADVHRAAKLPQLQENVMAIKVSTDGGGNLSTDAAKLMTILNETSFRPVGIMLHPRGDNNQ